MVRFRTLTPGRLTLGLAVFACAVLLASAVFRGPDFDEFATVQFTDPSMPLADVWRHLWLNETNPPLFYWLARQWTALTGPLIVSRRMINGFALAAMMAWFAATYRARPQQRGFLTLYLLITLVSHFFIFYFAEYRSYFFQFAAATVFLGSAALDQIEGRTRISKAELAAIPFLFELHQVTALYAGATLLLLMISDVRLRTWRRLSARAGVALISGAPLLVFTWLQLHQPHAVIDAVDWIPRLTTGKAAAQMANFVGRGLGGNLISLVAAVGVLLAAALRPKPETARFLGLLACATALASLAILIINHFTPLIVDRYFSFPTAVACCAMALLSEPLTARHPKAIWLFAAQAWLCLTVGAVQLVRDQRWNDGADKLAALASQCAGTRIHGGAVPESPIEWIGLNDLAARRGLHLLPFGLDQPGRCSVLYWTETKPPNRLTIALAGGDLVRAANDTAQWRLPQTALVHATLVRTKDGAILIVRR